MFPQYDFSELLISIFTIALLKYFEIENFPIKVQVRSLFKLLCFKDERTEALVRENVT